MGAEKLMRGSSAAASVVVHPPPDLPIITTLVQPLRCERLIVRIQVRITAWRGCAA